MMMDSKLNCLDPRKQELLEARFLGAKVSAFLVLLLSRFVCWIFTGFELEKNVRKITVLFLIVTSKVTKCSAFHQF